jgi:hypothetical protein
MDWIYGRTCGTLPFTRPGIAGPAEGDAMQTIRRDLMKTLSFAVLHFGIAFYFHERAWRRVDEREPARNNGPAMCFRLLKAR